MAEKYQNKKIHKSSFICKNCGGEGHNMKACKEPIMSWGVILVKLEGMKGIKVSHKAGTDINNLTMDTESDCVSIRENNYSFTYSLINQIKFLMVSRRNSLGYIEFIRGRYHLSNIDQITFLFEQMLPEEIKKIKDHKDDFNFLWTELWGEENTVSRYHKDFKRAKTIFGNLKKGFESCLSLDWFLENVSTSPNYAVPEHGFPKGRKNHGESDRDCAIREFVEETGLKKTDIKVIDEIDPIVENIIGTDGKKYRHIYYLAETITDNMPKLNDGKHQKYEIGSIKFLSCYDAEYYIRSYHKEKLNIVKNLVFYYLNKLINVEDIMNHLKKINNKNVKKDKGNGHDNEENKKENVKEGSLIKSTVQ